MWRIWINIWEYLVSRISEPTVMAAGNFAKSLPSYLISVIVAILSAYFFIDPAGGRAEMDEADRAAVGGETDDAGDGQSALCGGRIFQGTV